MQRTEIAASHPQSCDKTGTSKTREKRGQRAVTDSFVNILAIFSSPASPRISLSTASKAASPSTFAVRSSLIVGCLKKKGLRVPPESEPRLIAGSHWRMLTHHFPNRPKNAGVRPSARSNRPDLTTFAQTVSAGHSLKTRMLRWRLPYGSPSKLGNIRAGFLAHPLSYNTAAIARGYARKPGQAGVSVH